MQKKMIKGTNIMKYRNFGSTGLKVPALGFGAMRLPMTNGRQGYTGIAGGTVDKEESIKMIRHAIDRGMNYIDVAYNYLNGESEKIVGEALQDNYRDKTILVSKCPVWFLKEPEDFDKYLQKQLDRLQTDHLDIYLMHGIGKASWQRKILKLNILQKIEEAKASGKIRYAGFSFHDVYSAFEEIADGYSWDVCQIQLNYYDTDFQAGIKGLKYAAERGMGVSIMEPLRGGYLTRLPERAMKIIHTEGQGRTPAELSFDYLWNMPEVSLVLSGMGSVEQIDENIAYAEKSHVGMLSDDDLVIYSKIVDALNSYDIVKCTGCSYCSVCPKHIAIPYVFQTYNYYFTGNKEEAVLFYRDQMLPFGAYPDKCTGCKVCEERCPQDIPISEWMPKIAEMFNEILGNEPRNNAF